MPGPNRIEDLEQVRSYISGYDLSPVRRSLTQNLLPWDHQWSEDHVEFAEEIYRRWVFLVRKHEESRMPPSNDIDGFWHAHILHTYSYAEFCDRVFGYFLHHNGGFGTKDEAEFEELRVASNGTREFYEAEYGEPLYAHIVE